MQKKVKVIGSLRLLLRSALDIETGEKCVVWAELHILSMKRLCDYRIARKFRGIKFSRKLIRLSFHNLIFADSNPIAIISDVNIVSQIKIFASREKSAKTAKILSHETF